MAEHFGYEDAADNRHDERQWKAMLMKAMLPRDLKGGMLKNPRKSSLS